MEIGQRVHCKSDDLNLDNVQGTITRTKVLGIEDRITVELDTGKRVAFFGRKLQCVGRDGPLPQDPTKDPQDPTTEPPPPKKRITRKKTQETL